MINLGFACIECGAIDYRDDDRRLLERSDVCGVCGWLLCGRHIDPENLFGPHHFEDHEMPDDDDYPDDDEDPR